ncbi:50S ribosomal protein L10 [Candidatus Magnetobacterium bavaricum]|uniref:Large ribosomal subunit protein uL10 n=1 Tax=Candidatus Magnetobacterium bavaricum TaxID=29290 RepID=A0A0F3GTD5_9BACT|nr:50S ribosomal protein L10 [Candidatus Magnetobacterium bavaricum]
MKMNKKGKEEIVADLKERFLKSKAVVLTNYKGMTNAELATMRVLFRKSELEYKVVKNTLAKIAAKNTPLAVANDVLTGPIGMTIGYNDAAMTAKKTFEYAKGNDKFQVLYGCVEGRLFDAKQMKTIADLPPKEVLLSQIAGCLQAPTSQMARLLGATVSRIGHALNALKEKKETVTEQQPQDSNSSQTTTDSITVGESN